MRRSSAVDSAEGGGDRCSTHRESFIDTEVLVGAMPARGLCRASGSSSMGSSLSSRSSGSSRFRAPLPMLRRSLAQDDDPCMLAASYQDDWSDDDEDEEETKEEEGATGSTRTTRFEARRRPMHRSHTERTRAMAPSEAALLSTASGAIVDTSTDPVEPLFIRVRKFASTSAIDIRPPESQSDDAADALEQGALSPLDEELKPAIEDDDAELLRTARFSPLTFAPSPSSRRRSSTLSPSHHASPPPVPVTRWQAMLIGFRRWYGRILNSYFAFWLVVCSLVVLFLDLLVLLLLVVLRHEKETAPIKQHGSDHGDHKEVFEWCHTMTRGALNPIHYLGAATCLVLALPVVLPTKAFSLYTVRGDGRLLRRPFLHVCELLATAEVVLLLYFALDQGYRLPFSLDCHRAFTLAELGFFYATLLLWLVLWAQLTVFVRFQVHLALQADAANDATHTSALRDWLRDWLPRVFTSSKSFRKRLYRAAARGDAEEVDALLDKTPLASSLYSTRPTFWLGAFAASTKNPLHVAAARGHTRIVLRLLRAGFSANALDKVARVNFNIGLVFKLATRAFIKTQDGAASPLRSMLCSVLLPPLHGAVAAGHVAVVRALVEKGNADVNLMPRASFFCPEAQMPALFLADDPQVLALLVAHGANVLAVAANPRHSPLQRSALTLRSAATEYLLTAGADVALTPLHEAAAKDDLPRIHRLLRTDSNQVDVLGERVQGVLRRTPLHWAAVSGHVASASLLLTKGADPNAKDRHGRTPLHWAARRGHAAVVSLLLSHGADACAEDVHGVSVLAFAAEADNVGAAVVAALVAHGASLRAGDPSTGDTPLHIALARENRTTAVALIRCGADLVARNAAGVRAVDVTSSTQLQLALRQEAGTRDVMLSYPHAAFGLAQRVRATLEREGKATCWMDTMDPSGIGGGAVWREEIARGVYNCALVVSVVAAGYARSSWCLKELALAKMLRKPVLGLMVATEDEEEKENELMELVPHDCRVLFPLGGTAEEEAWRHILPRVKQAISGGRERRLSSGGTDSEPEQEEVLLQRSGDANAVRVAVCSTLEESDLCARLVRDLGVARGVVSRQLLLPSREKEDETMVLNESDILVVLLETVVDGAQRAAAAAAVERLLVAQPCRWPRLRVVPVAVRRNFLSFSNLYTLSQSRLLYVVHGVAEQSARESIRKHLLSVAREQERHRPRAGSLPQQL